MTETGTRSPERPAQPGSTADQLAQLGLRARTSGAYRAPAAAPPPPAGEPARAEGDIDQGSAGRTPLYDGSYRDATDAQVQSEISRLRDRAARER